MNLIAKGHVLVPGTAYAVYAYVSNMENFGEWFPGVLSICSVDSVSHGVVGKRYLKTVSVPLRGERQIQLEVVAAEAGRTFATEGVDAVGDGQAREGRHEAPRQALRQHRVSRVPHARDTV